jgi:hypothetical protein
VLAGFCIDYGTHHVRNTTHTDTGSSTIAVVSTNKRPCGSVPLQAGVPAGAFPCTYNYKQSSTLQREHSSTASVIAYQVPTIRFLSPPLVKRVDTFLDDRVGSSTIETTYIFIPS